MADKLLSLNGVTLSISDWARKLGINRTTLSERLRSGLALGLALQPGRKLPGPLVDLPAPGTRFAFLTVLDSPPVKVGGSYHVWCSCDCGNKTLAQPHALRVNHRTSCGCKRQNGQKMHGLRNHPLYTRWLTMHERCRNPNSHMYKYYGAKGVYVCDAWQDFPRFLADMGVPPGKGFEIDRIDNSGPYSPENCRWLTKTENIKKSFSDRKITTKEI